MDRFPQDTTPLPPSRPGSSHWRVGDASSNAPLTPDDTPTTYAPDWVDDELYPPHDAPTVATRIPAGAYRDAYIDYGSAARRPDVSVTRPSRYARYRVGADRALQLSGKTLGLIGAIVAIALIAALALGITLGRSMGLVGGQFPGAEPTHTPVITDFLSGALASTPGAVNLTSEGVTDWAQWGLQSATDFNHKATGGAISDFTSVGSGYVLRYATNTVGFSWSDGAPTASATHTTTEIFVIGAHNGFTFSVPADRTTRTLRVYVGVYAAQGQLQATLSNSSLAPYSSSALNTTSAITILNGVYTIAFRSRMPNQRLTIQFTALAAHNFLGSVGLQAATLH